MSALSAFAKSSVEPWARFTIEPGHASDGPNGVHLKSIRFLPVKESNPLDLNKCEYDLFFVGLETGFPMLMKFVSSQLHIINHIYPLILKVQIVLRPSGEKQAEA